MTTIYLIWLLVGGLPSDVKSFPSETMCMAAWAVNAEHLRLARMDPSRDTTGAELSTCQPIEVPVPSGKGQTT